MAQVQQTVAINIVVSGTGDKATVRTLDEPLKRVHKQAKEAGHAIKIFITNALDEAIARAINLQRAIGGTATAARLGAFVGAGGGVADYEKSLKQLDEEFKKNAAGNERVAQSVRRVGAATRATSRIMNFFGRIVNTLTKAIISMIGVMIFWTALITIPTLAIKGFIELTKWAIRSADAIQQVQITLSALIASTHDFGGTIEENFKRSLDWAKRVHLAFIRLSADSLATAEELEYAYQAFLAGGGEQLVRSLEEEIELTALLGAAILTLTGREKARQQLFTETRAIMEGRAAPGAQMVRFIQSQVGDYDVWINKIRESKNGLEEFTKILKPFAEAGKEQAVTITGLATSIKGYAEALNVTAVKGGPYKIIQGYLLNVRDTLGDAIQDLTTVEGGINNLAEPTRNVVKAFALLAAIIQIIIIRLANFLGITNDSKDTAETMVDTMEKLVGIIAKVSAVVSGVFNGLKLIWNVVYSIWKSIQIAFEFIIMGLLEAIAWLAEALDMLGGTVLGFIPGVKSALNWLREGTKEWADDAAIALQKDYALLERSTGKIGEAFKGLYRGYERVSTEIMTDTKNLANELERIMVEAYNIPLGERPEARKVPETLSDQQLRAYQRLQQQLEVTQADENELLKIYIQQAQKANEIYRTFMDVPKHREKALAVNELITEELIKQANIKVERGVIESLQVSIDTILAGYDEFSQAEAKLNAQILKVNHDLYERGDLLQRAIDLTEQESFLRLRNSVETKIQDLRLQSIAERSGELVALEYRREAALLAINMLHMYSIEQKRTLIDLTNEQYNRERAITEEQNRRKADTAVLELTEQINKLKGSTSGVAEAQARYYAATKALLEETKGDTINGRLRERKTLLEIILGLEIRAAQVEVLTDEAKFQIDTLREYSTVLQSTIDDYASLNASTEDIHRATARLNTQIITTEGLLIMLRAALEYAAGHGDTEGAKSLEARIKEMEAALRRAKIELANVIDMMEAVGIVAERSRIAMQGFIAGSIDLLTMLGAVALDVAFKIANAMGSAFTQMFQALFSGEDGMEAFLKGIGQVLIQVGELAVGLGTVGLLAKAIGLFPWVNVGAAIAMIAVGTGLIAAGVALGGGGARGGAETSAGGGISPEESARRQQEVMAQQGIYDAINANTEAITNLNSELGRLSKEKGDVLVTNAVKSNPGAILKPLTNKVNRSYTSQRNLKTALNIG